MWTLAGQWKITLVLDKDTDVLNRCYPMTLLVVGEAVTQGICHSLGTGSAKASDKAPASWRKLDKCIVNHVLCWLVSTRQKIASRKKRM